MLLLLYVDEKETHTLEKKNSTLPLVTPLAVYRTYKLPPFGPFGMEFGSKSWGLSQAGKGEGNRGVTIIFGSNTWKITLEN